MGILDHLPCLLRNLDVGQAATVRTLYGTIDWFRTDKGIRLGCLLSPCLFNLYAKHIMSNVGLDELQARINITRRNINLGYADDTTLIAESKEELKNLLMGVKEQSEKAGLKLLKEKKYHGIQPHYLMAHRREKGGSSDISSSSALKPLRMETADMKLDDCFLAGKL